ncbi:uncharacterized protein LOC119774478 [Cyprinodon tularosa]|uniref:uncharacterized protein LOC119774478 n=1 Tax=Cyprinodon tularosa TaxID=77115 RepID=UPI0018E28E8D|nr:uncharacterized protein LOC119774478 [Cyprinodon tularosa]
MSKNFIYENATIDEGPPARIRLTTTKRNLDGDQAVSRIKRCSLGEEDPSKPNKTILLVGETGAGKSAFINTFLNYAMGVKKEDKVWYEIVHENVETSKSECVTFQVTVYDIFGFEGQTLPFSLTIIDTPGYGDTRGIENDALVARKLLDLFRSEDGVSSVDAVGLVLKASDNQPSDRLIYIFNSVLALFGKDLESNIVALITHSDGMPPKVALKALEDANIKMAKNEKGQPVHFVFNNCLSTTITEDTEFGLDQAWAVTIGGMTKLTAFLENSQSKNLDNTISVLNEQIGLTACVNNLADRIDLNKKKQEEIKQTLEGLEKYQNELSSGEKFTLEVDEPYKEKRDIYGGMRFFMFGGAVTCNVCEENCHYPGCTVAWYPSHCKVMKNGRCTVCTNKCPANKHVKEQKKYVIKTRKVSKTIEELKQMHEKNLAMGESLLSKLQDETEKLETEINSLLDKAYNHLLSLEKNALSFGSLFAFVDINVIIEELKERKDTEKVQKLEEISGQFDKRTWGGLRYAWGNIKSKLAKGIEAIAI